MTSNTAAAPASPPAPATGPAPGSPPADGPRPAAASAVRSPVASPVRVLVALAQLAALGVVGPVVFTVLITLLSTGIGTAVVLGIGLLLLIGFVYALWAVAWLEAARIDGLYHVGVPAPALRRRPRPGFGGVLLMFWRQAIDPGVWRGIANFAIATALGLVTILLVAVLVSGIALTLSPLLAGEGVSRLWGWDLELPATWAFVVGPVMVALSAAALIGVAILHGVLSRLIMVPSREAQLAAQARQSAEQRAGAVRAADVERTRIERDLHDGVQPRLVSVGMTLGLARQKIDDDPAAATALIEEAHTSTKAAITELRQLARGIHASVLDDRGLDAALSALAARSHVPVQLDVRIEGRCERSAEAAVYFAIAESLTNAAKHSRASAVRVVVRRRDDGTLWTRVEDDGIGGARILPGGGLDGISNRIVGAGGTYRLDSPHGGPTALEVSVPCAF
ncbi:MULTISPECIES: sensor histidine kinase [Microbacterium]|uniref:histidine kinase n=1 Tax=Microbacterium wangchenii TaxID=2541726 RepID=A0ABX5SMM9_9MICO|nr:MULTISPECIES: histidine kinase [Microbacterium]MCK6066420.1 sensor domain-containing protein [Microbacterium sp. EYE_512]QBR87386.1 sensor histidine kinase [Microbacterium wangchenii]TXK14708.1 sensor histidine kinase [Microbacterium wangchenii]